MAVNYYGTCTGNSASKYNLWVKVTRNYQSASTNQSNVTINFYVKRNDGYSNSAYNLNESDNSVKLTVNNSVLVDKNIEIDTRNNVTLLLATWTGNLTHDDNGVLSVPLKAEFVMKNAGLSSGIVSATLTCTTIQRKSTAVFSSATINPGGFVTATITTPNSTFSHKIVWGIGDKSTSVSLAAGVLTTQISIPKDWLTALVSARTGSVSVVLTTYNGVSSLGENTYTLSLVVPETDEYKPDFSIGLTRIDNGVPADWGLYVQGKSKVTVSPDGLSFKYGASLDRLTITVGSVSIRSLPATFTLTEYGELTVTVAVRDTRGLLTVKTTTITVHQYSPPSVEIQSLERCNSYGMADTMGKYLCVKYALSYSSIGSKNSAKVYVKYKTPDDTTYSNTILLGTSPAVFGNGSISVNSSVDVFFSVQDSISSSGMELTRSVSSGAIPFNIKRGGTGASFGKFSEKDNELSIGWDLSVDGNVHIGGNVNSVVIPVECSENSTDLAGSAIYYPFINGCFVRIRVKAQKKLAADTTHILAHIPGKPPGIFTPLDSLANYSSGGISTAGVVYKTGDIAFRSDTDVEAGTYIYISGFYLADYTE